MKTAPEYRLAELTQLAWVALIQAMPTANPSQLSVKAVELAKAMLETEKSLVGSATTKA